MARVGPNQDINDANILMELLLQYQAKSELIGLVIAQYLQSNINAEGSEIIPISIPRKLSDGSTQLLLGSDAQLFDQDAIDNALSDSVLLTYVELAERFREYFETFKSSLSIIPVLEQTITFTHTAIPSAPGEESFPGSYPFTLYGTEGGRSTDIDTINFNTQIPDTPVWSGSAPANYNSGTYPQLANMVDLVWGSSFPASRTATENYKWITIEDAKRISPVFGHPFAVFDLRANASYSRNPGDLSPFIEIPNFSDSEMIVQLTGNATSARLFANLDTDQETSSILTERATVTIVSGIGNWGDSSSASMASEVDVDPNNHENAFFLPSELGALFSLTASLDVEVTIPPGQSLFFHVTAECYGFNDVHPNTFITWEAETIVGINGGNIAVPDIPAEKSYSFSF